jgi:hypothetical protein
VDDQLFGLDGLVNLSNLIFVFAFSVRDLLALRILAIASSIVIVPYYYLQPVPLWQPIVWEAVSVLITGPRVVQLVLEWRPVVLSEREQELYRLAFGTLDKREFLKFADLATWETCLAGAKIVERGQVADEAIVLISGEVEAIASDRPILKYLPGQLIGDTNVYSGIAGPLDVVATSASRLARRNLAQLHAFLEARPALRIQLLTIEGANVAAKSHAAARI